VQIVRLNGAAVGFRETLFVEMSKQGLSDLRYLLKSITLEDTQQQINQENFPTRLAVDNKESTSLAAVQRKTEVQFGNTLDQLLIRAIERSLMSSIRSNAVSPKQAAFGSMSYWEWAFAPKVGQQAASINVTDLTALPIGSYLILRPKSGKIGVANMYAARKDAGVPLGGPGRSGGRGFMAKGISALKRSRLAKNYTIRIAFTQRYKLGDELYSHGTPVVVLRARRNVGYRRLRIV
jgi:hypothetical protein